MESKSRIAMKTVTHSLPTPQQGEHHVPRLCVVVCYMGPWPNYLPLYLHTCAYNPEVDFLLLGDHPAPPQAPPNVRFVPFSLAEFNHLATYKLGFKVEVTYAFKLCDFKAAYGHLFEDYLEGYDYWVLGDIDLVYGRIPAFWNHSALAGYDLVASRKEFLTGHGTVFRNVPFINCLYQRSPDFERVFRSSEFYSFSECNKLWRHFSNGGNAFDHQPAVVSMTHLVHALAREDALKPQFVFHIREEGDLRGPWSLVWDGGHLTQVQSGEELLYFHFHNYKHRWLYRIPRWISMPARIRMNRWGFFDGTRRGHAQGRATV